MIYIEQFPGETCRTYLVEWQNRSTWYFPSHAEPEFAHISVREAPFFETFAGYSAPPSHELRTLIEAAAPWYVVIDKLIEEYPQWQSHFEAAAAAERQRTEVA